MEHITVFAKKILKIIIAIEDIICATGLWVTTILIFCAIVNRYFLHLPIIVLFYFFYAYHLCFNYPQKRTYFS